MTKMNIDDIKKDFVILMGNPEFRSLTLEEQSKQLGISTPTLKKWQNDATAEQWIKWEKECEAQVARKAPEIDSALTKKALGGDVKAVELWYQKIKGWSAKQISEIRNTNVDDEKDIEELKKQVKDELKKELTKEEIEQLLKSLK